MTRHSVTAKLPYRFYAFSFALSIQLLVGLSSSLALEPDSATFTQREVFQLLADPVKDQILGYLTKASANQTQIKQAIEACRLSELPDLFYVLENLKDLDLVDCTAEQLVDIVRESRINRKLLFADLLPDDIYQVGLLQPVVSPYQHLAVWRNPLRAKLGYLRRDTVATTVRAVTTWVETEFPVREIESYFGPQPNPWSLVQRGWGSAYERNVLCVGLLQCCGVPAMLSKVKPKAIDYYDGKTWQTFLLRTDELASDSATPSEDLDFGTVTLSLIRNGLPVMQEEAFDFSIWEDGRWCPVSDRDFPLDVQAIDDHYVVGLPPGEYLVTAGTRNSIGEPYIKTQIIQVAPRASILLDLVLDIPLGQRKPADRLVRPLATLPEFELLDESAKTTLRDSTKWHNVLLIIHDQAEEPSQRMLPLLYAMKPELEANNVKSFTVSCNPVRSLRPDKPFPETHDKDLAIVKTLGLALTDKGTVANLPSVLLLQRGGAPVLWTEGYNLAIDSLIREAIAFVQPPPPPPQPVLAPKIEQEYFQTFPKTETPATAPTESQRRPPPMPSESEATSKIPEPAPATEPEPVTEPPAAEPAAESAQPAAELPAESSEPEAQSSISDTEVSPANPDRYNEPETSSEQSASPEPQATVTVPQQNDQVPPEPPSESGDSQPGDAEQPEGEETDFEPSAETPDEATND